MLRIRFIRVGNTIRPDGMEKIMKNEIKEFLSKFDNAIEAVEKEPEQAGKLVCEAVGWEISGVYFDLHNCSWRCEDLIQDYTLFCVHELEKAVIEKVGEDLWWSALCVVLNLNIPKNVNCGGWQSLQQLKIRAARADAKTRLAALLMALAEVEGCD